MGKLSKTRSIIYLVLAVPFFFLLILHLFWHPYKIPDFNYLQAHSQRVNYDLGECNIHGGQRLSPSYNYWLYSTSDASGQSETGYQVCSPHKLKVGSVQTVYASAGSHTGYVKSNGSDTFNYAQFFIYLVVASMSIVWYKLHLSRTRLIMQLKHMLGIPSVSGDYLQPIYDSQFATKLSIADAFDGNVFDQVTLVTVLLAVFLLGLLTIITPILTILVIAIVSFFAHKKVRELLKSAADQVPATGKSMFVVLVVGAPLLTNLQVYRLRKTHPKMAQALIQFSWRVFKLEAVIAAVFLLLMFLLPTS